MLLAVALAALVTALARLFGGKTGSRLDAPLGASVEGRSSVREVAKGRSGYSSGSPGPCTKIHLLLGGESAPEPRWRIFPVARVIPGTRDWTIRSQGLTVHRATNIFSPASISLGTSAFSFLGLWLWNLSPA